VSGAAKVLLGTWNPAKQDALRRVIYGMGVTVLTPEEAGLDRLVIPEEGRTYLDNAVLKAKFLAHAAGIAAISSDGGLEIPALGDRWKGLRSRRFAGPTDEDRIRALLEMMEGIPAERRTARFHEAVALVETGGRIVASAQQAGPDGRIAEQADPRRVEGFWVPSLWLYPPRWVTEWDLEDAERRVSRTAWDAVADEVRPGLALWAAGAC